MEINNLSKALCDVRKAHRLLYEYQTRVTQLVDYIKDMYNMNGDGGNKYFSNHIAYTNAPYSTFKVERGLWAWDFLYSYMFEFYLGDATTEDNQKEYCLSIVEVSDTGYFDSQSNDARNISSFSPVDKSSSYFIFVFECVNSNKKDYYWKDKKTLGEELHRFLYSQKEQYIKDTSTTNFFILCKYNLTDFSNQSDTNKILIKFSNLIKEKTNIILLKRKVE